MTPGILETTAALNVSQDIDGRGVLWLARPGRSPVYVGHRETLEAARAVQRGMMAEFDRLIRLIPTTALERALTERSA